MKIFEVIEARKGPVDDYDDLDDVIDKPEDPEADKIPHILMQMRKALDVDGNFEFKFKDGSKHKLAMPDIVTFVKKYMTSKPVEKEKMQNKAIQSLEGLMSVINAKEMPKSDMRIKGDRYMSGFAGDYDDK